MYIYFGPTVKTCPPSFRPLPERPTRRLSHPPLGSIRDRFTPCQWPVVDNRWRDGITKQHSQDCPLPLVRRLQPDPWRSRNPVLHHQDGPIPRVLMAGPPSSLPATSLDQDIILQNFGVSYERLLFYTRLNTIGNQVCISHSPVQSRIIEAFICSDSLPLQQGCFIYMTI
jgi:hypothetical protein